MLERGLQVDPEGVEALRATFEAAMAFGFSDEEIWVVPQQGVGPTTPETAIEAAVERLTADLAGAILPPDLS